jgi:hypothetical protein
MAKGDFAACKTNIEGTLGREMTPEEKRAIKNRAPEIMRKIANTGGTPGEVARILQTAKDDADGRKAFNQRANAIEFRAVTEFVDRFFKANETIKHAGEALQSITKGSLWNFRGSNDSLANLIDREISSRKMAFDADLHTAGLLEVAYSGELDAKIIGAEEQIRKGLPVDPKWGNAATTIAQIFEKHTEAGRQDMNANGAWIPKNDDRLFAMRYDHNRIASGDGNFKWGSKEAQAHYVDEYMKRMDWSKAFGGDFANATDAQRRERVADIWHQFTQDTHFKSGPQFFGPGKTYGIQPHIEMVLKTPQDSYEMWKQFGRGNSLAEAHNTELGRIGQNLAVMKMLGVRAEKALRQAVSVIHTKLMTKGGTFEEIAENKRQAALLDKSFNDEMQNTWRLITDTVAHPNDNIIGRTMSGLRLTLNTTATAFSLPTLITDLNLKAVRLASQGRGSWLGNLYDGAMMQFTPKGLTEAERAQFAAQIGISLEINKRPTDLGLSEHRVYDGVRKFNSAVRSVTGHSVWDNSARLSSQIRDYMHYHDIKGKEWGDLVPGEQATLNSFGIDRIGWDVMRKAQSIDIPGGWGKGISPDQIRAMPLDEFKSLSTFQNPSPVTLKRMRDRLADQYRNLLGENANRTVSSPSTARLARLRVGRYYDPNTVHGWAMSQAMALKGWAINYMTEHLGRGIVAQYSEHQSMGKIMKDLMTGQNTQGIKTTAQYMVGGIGLAYVTNMMRSLAMGKAPVNPIATDPRKDLMDQPWVDAFSEATARGAAGIYGDFLFGQSGGTDTTHPLEDKLMKIALGPEGEFYLKVGDLLQKSTKDAIKAGGVETKAIRKDEQQAFGVAYHALPPSNLLATKWALDYYFFNALSEKINPGYQKRLQDYAKRQNTYYLAGQPGAR